MAYVPVPKDLTVVKTKILFGLTLRQIICFLLAAVVGFPLFFILKNYMDPALAIFIMIVVMMPFFLLAIYEKNGQPFEKYAGNFVRTVFLRPKKRIYRTCNFYSAIETQNRFDKEVSEIVSPKRKKKR